MNIDIKTADGEEIELGGAYYDGRGTEYRAVGELRSLRLFWQECVRLFIVHRRQRRNLRRGCHARHRIPHPQAEG